MKSVLFALVLALPMYGQKVSTFGPQGPACVSAAQFTAANIGAFPTPKDWTWVVVCDEPSWGQAVRHAGLAYAPEMVDGVSFLDRRITILRARVMDAHLLAHEAAHIYLATHDESKAEGLASKWLKEYHPQHERTSSGN